MSQGKAPAGAALALVIAGLVVPAAARPAEPGEVARGRALFVGEIPLQGRLASHVTDLPSEVLRCANCHSSAGSPAVVRTVAPPLTRDWLLAPRSRHGGPPSNYELASFCAVLQRGEDPAHLIVNVQMPRYAVAERDCMALWQFLSEEGHD